MSKKLLLTLFDFDVSMNFQIAHAIIA